MGYIRSQYARTVRRDALRLGQPRAQRAREHLEAVGAPGLAVVPLDLDLPPGRVPVGGVVCVVSVNDTCSLSKHGARTQAEMDRHQHHKHAR